MTGIPMKTWEVQAILSGRKTVFRRVVKPQPEVLIKIENGGVYYADNSGKWCHVEGNPVLAKQRLYGRDGRPYLLSNEICGIWSEGVYRLVPLEGTSGQDGLSLDFNMPSKQEKDDECTQSHLRGVSWATTGLCTGKAYGRKSVKQCSGEPSVGNGARELERQETAPYSDHRGETPNVKINRCTENGDCRPIKSGNEPEEDCGDLFCEPICYLESIKIPFSVGQIMYVRETWRKWIMGYSYKADAPWASQWRPSTQMPRKAARIFLRVTDVRVERLQDITEEQARAEGAEPFMLTTDIDKPDNEKRWHEMLPALMRFPEFWNSTLKPKDRALYGWEANPYVWAVEFERISKEEAKGGRSSDTL